MSPIEELIKKLEIDTKKIDLKEILEKIYPSGNYFNTIETNQNNSKEPICLLGFGRSGSLFLQSLLDGHPEVSTLPGYFFKGWFNQKSWPIFEPDYSDFNWREQLAENICKYFEPQFNAHSKKSVIGMPRQR